MSKRLIKIFCWGMLACTFVLSGWLFYHGVGHSLAHAHHTNATHADALCTWLCSAGQAIDAFTIILPHPTPLPVPADTSFRTIPLSNLAIQVFPRGPPGSFPAQVPNNV